MRKIQSLDALLSRAADLDGALLNLDQSLKEVQVDNEGIHLAEETNYYWRRFSSHFE